MRRSSNKQQSSSLLVLQIILVLLGVILLLLYIDHRIRLHKLINCESNSGEIIFSYNNQNQFDKLQTNLNNIEGDSQFGSLKRQGKRVTQSTSNNFDYNLQKYQKNQQKQQLQQQQQVENDSVFLFVGVLSKANYTNRREVQRIGWTNEANQMVNCSVKFVLSKDEADEDVLDELKQYKDIIFAHHGGINYRSIFPKTVFVFQYAVENLNAKFILKTDDDAFIYTPGLVDRLFELCTNTECSDERLYIGNLKTNAIVNIESGHPWNDQVYVNYTHLDYYPPYMFGGGYVLSADLAQILVALYKQNIMFFTPIEDATMGVWLFPFNITRVNWPTFITASESCCKSSRPIQYNGTIDSYQTWRKKALSIPAPIRRRLCPSDRKRQALVIHKVDEPEKMVLLGELYRNCVFMDELHSKYKSCARGSKNCQWWASSERISPGIGQSYLEGSSSQMVPQKTSSGEEEEEVAEQK